MSRSPEQGAGAAAPSVHDDGEEDAETSRRAPRAEELPSTDRSLIAALEILTRMNERLEEIEDAIAEVNEAVGKVRKQVDGLEKVVAKKKQVKKIVKVLDQLEVLEEDDDDTSSKARE